MFRTNLVNIRVFEVDDEYRVDIVDRADDNIYEAFLYQKDEVDKTLILRENKSSDDEETALAEFMYSVHQVLVCGGYEDADDSEYFKYVEPVEEDYYYEAYKRRKRRYIKM